MSSRKKLTLSLQEATEYAQLHGLIGGDFYELDDDTIASLRNLYDRTKWRQSESSKQRGIGIIRAFYYALTRRNPKRTGLITNDQVQLAHTLEVEAEGAWKIAQRQDSRQHYEQAAVAFELVGETYEDIGNTYKALNARKRAKSIRKAADLNYPPSSRDRRRPVRRRRARTRTRTRRDASSSGWDLDRYSSGKTYVTPAVGRADYASKRQAQHAADQANADWERRGRPTLSQQMGSFFAPTSRDKRRGHARAGRAGWFNRKTGRPRTRAAIRRASRKSKAAFRRAKRKTRRY